MNSYNKNEEEIIEDEVIERDEYYEADDVVEYDEYYPEEYYEPPYNPEFDAKIERALIEIADIRDSLSYPNAESFVDHSQQMPSIISPELIQQVYPKGQYPFPEVQQPSQEVNQYSEIGKLRDELAKAKTTHELQKEVARLKEQVKLNSNSKMARLEGAIDRLVSKIEQFEKRK